MPVSMAKSGIFGLDNDQDGRTDTANIKPMVKEPSYYMDNYEATITVHTSPPQQHVTNTQPQFQPTSGEYLEIDDETRDFPESGVFRRKLSKKKNLRVTFSDHIEVDLIEDLYDDVDGDVGEFSVVEENVYEIVKAPNNTKLAKGNLRFRETISVQTPKPFVISHGSPELKVANENISPKSPPGSPKRTDRKPKVTSAKSNKQVVPPQCSSPPLLPKRRISQSAIGESEKTTKDYLQELRVRRQSQNKKSINLNTLFPNLGANSAKVTQSQPSYSNFLSDAKRAVDRVNTVSDRPWSNRSPEKPVYGLYDQRKSDMQRSAGTVRKSASLPRNFKLPDTLYSGRYRRPSTCTDSALLTANMRVK